MNVAVAIEVVVAAVVVAFAVVAGADVAELMNYIDCIAVVTVLDARATVVDTVVAVVETVPADNPTVDRPSSPTHVQISCYTKSAEFEVWRILASTR